MNVWWVNQGASYHREKAGGCIFAASSAHPNRKLVAAARKGDLVVHYQRPFLKAISRSITDGGWAFNSVHEEEGWTFRTEYYELRKPIHRNLVNDPIIELGMEKGPINLSGAWRGRVKLGYFYPFSVAGLRIIREYAGDSWPAWAPI